MAARMRGVTGVLGLVGVLGAVVVGVGACAPGGAAAGGTGTGGGAGAAVPSVAPFTAPATPEIFASGAISTTAPEFSISLSSDMRTAYFNRASEDRRFLTIMKAVLGPQGWTNADAVIFDTQFSNVDPFVTADGKRLYFSSNRPTAEADTVLDFNTWYMEKAGDGWSDPRTLPGVNSPGIDLYVTIDRAGTMYFSSNYTRVMRIYSSRLVNGAYQQPLLVDFVGNNEIGGGNPAIHPDGDMLVFVTGGDSADLYLTCLKNGKWTVPARIGNGVNSDLTDFAPSFTHDGKTFFFTSERPGLAPARTDGSRPPGDIYYVSAASLRSQCAAAPSR